MDLRGIGYEDVIWIDLARYGTSCGFCGHVNGPSGFMKFRRFLDWLKNYLLLRKEFGPWSLVN